MAASIAEYILMRYFFPGITDRKKTAMYKQAFMSDMQFNLSTGKVDKACKRLKNPLAVDSLYKIYSCEELFQANADRVVMLRVLDELNFMKSLPDFSSNADKLELLKCFELKSVPKG